MAFKKILTFPGEFKGFERSSMLNESFQKHASDSLCGITGLFLRFVLRLKYEKRNVRQH